MEQIKVKHMVEAVNGTLLCGDPETPLYHLSIDSRRMRGGDLFIPLAGEHNDAHRFLSQAMESGAAAALTSEHDEAPEGFQGALIRVGNTRRALQAIGIYLRAGLRLPLVGITGSVGKTTTREMVASALSAGFRVFKTPANYNSQIGVPLTLSEISPDDEIGVLELGMSEPGEMEVISHIARVDLAVITNVGVTHIENLGSRENILREKLNIQCGLREDGVLLLNGDNDLLREVRARGNRRTIFYGTGENCEYRAVDIRFDGGKPSFTMEHGRDRIPVTLSVLGEHNILNALAALAVADCCGVSLSAAADRLSAFLGYENRQQICESGGITIIDDTYNASPDSMKAGIRVLASLHSGGRRVAVLADMKELGRDALRFHQELGAFLASQPVDAVVTYGPLAAGIAEGLRENLAAPPLEGRTASKPWGGPCEIVSFAVEERQAMTAYLEETLRPGDAVLFKGSNSMKLWETASHFIRMGREKV